VNPLLELRALDKRFGGLHVTRAVSLTVQPGERLALIGPNGAGKTTLVNLISGVLAATTGKVLKLKRFFSIKASTSPMSCSARTRAGS